MNPRPANPRDKARRALADAAQHAGTDRTIGPPPPLDPPIPAEDPAPLGTPPRPDLAIPPEDPATLDRAIPVEGPASLDERAPSDQSSASRPRPQPTEPAIPAAVPESVAREPIARTSLNLTGVARRELAALAAAGGYVQADAIVVALRSTYDTLEARYARRRAGLHDESPAGVTLPELRATPRRRVGAEDLKIVAVPFRRSQRDALREIADRWGISLSELVSAALTAYPDRQLPGVQ